MNQIIDVTPQVIEPETPATSQLSAIANQLHGQAMLAGGARKFFAVAEIKILKEIQDRKLFKHIPIEIEPGIFRGAKNFSEYLENALDTSPSVVYEEIKTFEEFGDKAHDALNRLGVLRDDKRLLRKLPDEIKAQAQEAAESGDKSALLRIIDMQAEERAKERKAAAKEKATLEARLAQEEARAAGARADLAAKDGFIAKQAETIMGLQDQLEEKKNNPPDPLAEARAAVEALDATVLAIYTDIGTLALRDCLAVQSTHTDHMAEHGRAVIAQALGRIMSITRAIATDLDILPDEDAPSIFATAAGDDEKALWEATLRDFDAQKAAEQGE
ncbi:hypothetical protein SAMN02949497_1644 [Methylomagnum ishizawai]|uniref:Uncharacterized protein n=1 Tax=Methylomagnum ishizawai TaxID=1760988 RepID=A0A1Y6D1R4_9GAMM|nr:hypothetical protein [Methylomagnum ishizawai]SMF94334.1 hypothetical protein SAMN02949497_1644 [Methylomagnum ishizawai]